MLEIADVSAWRRRAMSAEQELGIVRGMLETRRRRQRAQSRAMMAQGMVTVAALAACVVLALGRAAC